MYPWNREKWKFVDKEFLILNLKNQDSSTWTSETGRNAYLFVFISSFVFFREYVYYFFDAVRDQTSYVCMYICKICLTSVKKRNNLQNLIFIILI